MSAPRREQVMAAAAAANPSAAFNCCADSVASDPIDNRLCYDNHASIAAWKVSPAPTVSTT